MPSTQPLTAAPAPLAHSASTAFDLALANEALYVARERYALQRGAYGTPGYRSAWVLFNQKVRTLEDLKAARARSRASQRPASPR